MTDTATKYPYYSFAKIDSYNAVYNAIAGGRGIGKTYGAKKKAIRAALKSLEAGTITKRGQFIYLRRYQTEMATRFTFFDDVGEEFPDYDFRVNGKDAEASPHSLDGDKKRPWVKIGTFVALSQGQTKKSTVYLPVSTIIFDEFILESGALHYLPDEANVFNNFYSTVDRWGDKTRVYFLANAVSIDNPYFIEWGIRPDETDAIGKSKVDASGLSFLAWHFPDSEAFATEVYKTRFGQFIQDTSYAEYAVGNSFADNHEELIQAKDPQARYQFTLETAKGTFTVWLNYKTNTTYVQAKRPKSNELFYTLDTKKMGEGKILMFRTDPPLARLRSAFRNANLWFDTPSTRIAFLEIFKR